MAQRTLVIMAVAAAVSTSTAASEAEAGDPGSAPASPAPASAPACSTGRAGALSELGCEARSALGGLPPGALLVAAPLVTDAKPRAANELSQRIVTVIAGALGVKASSEGATLSRARTLAAAHGTLVHLSAEVARGELRVTLDVYPVPRNFWDRVRDPEPNPKAHGFASRRLDAELRTFFPPVPLVAQRIDKAISTDKTPVAVACGDVDGDGALEIVLVGRARVQLGRARGGRFVSVASATWSELSPLSRAPLREPIASASIEPGRFVDIGLSDRLEAVRLNGSLHPVAKLGRRLPWPGGGCSKIQGTSVRQEVEPCQAGDPPVALPQPEKPVDALAGALVLDRKGGVRSVRAARAFNEPVVLVRDDRGKSARLEGVGAQLAVGDLDGDGQPEVLSGSDTLDPSGDALVIHTWQDDGALVERARIAVPTGVRAVAVCPPESAGLSPVALATAGGVWVIR